MASTGGITETTHSVAGLLEKVSRPGLTLWKHYVATPTGLSALYLRRSDGSADTYYLMRDHLGSTDQVLKAAGSSVVVAASFSALGARRGSNWSGAPSAADLAAIAATTAQGFTGHEMLDGVGLIHMHGRVYDPTMGRFLSVDPIVRDAAASQSWNGYGYVEGRMLSATDPDGFKTDVNCRTCIRPVDPTPDTDASMFEVVVTASPWPLIMISEVPGFWANVDNSRGIPTISEQESTGSDAGEGAQEPQEQQQESECSKQLVEFGNTLARASDSFTDASMVLIAAGLTISTAGFSEFGVPLAAAGASGGAYFGGGLQFLSGLAQGFGGAGFNNSRNALISLGAGGMVAKGMRYLAPYRGVATASQRTTSLANSRTRTYVGGVYDVLSNVVPGLGPQVKSCGSQPGAPQ